MHARLFTVVEVLGCDGGATAVPPADSPRPISSGPILGTAGPAWRAAKRSNGLMFIHASGTQGSLFEFSRANPE